MEEAIALFDTVALLDNLPGHGLQRGQVGTIVECLAPSVYEVEFSDEEGRAYAMLAIRAEQVVRLRYSPTHAA